MIDNVSILLSLLAVGVVVFKAVILDKKLPWFGSRQAPPVNRRPF